MSPTLLDRRGFLARLPAAAALACASRHAVARAAASEEPWIDPATAADWKSRWEKSILGECRDRPWDKENGEELGWLVSPLLEGFYHGYRATGDPAWMGRLFTAADAVMKRAVKEPDGYRGWPKGDGGGGASKEYDGDSLLGEAMMLRPLVLAARDTLRTPALDALWHSHAERCLALAGEVFDKFDARGCWRETKDGGVWVVSRFGIDRGTHAWSEGHARRGTEGFTNPANKQNHIARWLAAMHDATGKPVYRDRAEKWFRVMKSRLREREAGKYLVWNYWDPAGPWDYHPDGSPVHWVGVHPNGGYYGIDTEGMACAHEHGWVFSKEDIARLAATNRDFMWNQDPKAARFGRIDGGGTDPRWKNTPGVLWTGLVPHDPVLRRVFVANHKPDGWGGLAATPWFLALAREHGAGV